MIASGQDSFESASVDIMEDIEEVDDFDDLEQPGYWSSEDLLAEGESLDGVELVPGYPKCPSPTKWKLVSQRQVNGRMSMVSLAVKAGPTSVRHAFRVSRSMTYGASVTAGVKASIQIIEAETKLELSKSVTIGTSESVSYTIPRGKTMALFGGCAYIDRTFQRISYGSAMCNRVVQRTTIRSPRFPLLEVRLV